MPTQLKLQSSVQDLPDNIQTTPPSAEPPHWHPRRRRRGLTSVLSHGWKLRKLPPPPPRHGGACGTGLHRSAARMRPTRQRESDGHGGERRVRAPPDGGGWGMRGLAMLHPHHSVRRQRLLILDQLDQQISYFTIMLTANSIIIGFGI